MKTTFNNKLVFTTKDENGNEIELAVKKPNSKQEKELKKVWNIAFSEAVNSGAVLSAKVKSLAVSQNIWNEEKEEELKELQSELFKCERKLAQGGKAGLTKTKGRELALKMKELRGKIIELNAPRNSIDANTAESQATNEQFNHQVALCTYYNTGEKQGQNYFKDYDDYLEKTGTQAALDAGRYMALLQFNLNPNYEESLPENKFLIEYKFVNKDLRLIDKKGRLVDSQGRLIREDGRYINEAGELIDAQGNRVDEEGNYVVESSPFLPDEDEEGVESKEEVVVQKKPVTPSPAK